MKRMKKIGSLLLVLVMATALTVSAFAAPPAEGEGTDKKVTPAFPAEITVKSGMGSGHAFDVYQIFVADVAADGGSLANVTWASGVNATQLVEDLKGQFFAPNEAGENVDIFGAVDATNAGAVAQIISDYFKPGASLAADATKLGEAIGKSIETHNTIPAKQSSLPCTVTTGWCLIVDKLESNPDSKAYILKQITGDLELEPKTGTSTVTKEVQQTDGTWSDGAIYTPSEEYNIPFKVTVTLPEDLNEYPKMAADNSGITDYFVKLTDTHVKGLEIDINSIKVMAGGHELTKTDSYVLGSFQVTTGGTDENPSFEIFIDKVQNLNGVKPGDVIEITYNGRLAADAVSGTAGNSNKVELETPEGKTPGDEVKVFELALKIDKVDGEGNPLEGAEFTVQKVTGQNEDGSDILEPANVEVVKDETGTKFVWKGLEPGRYLVTETPPAGYNPVEPVYITVDGTTVKVDGSLPGNLTVTDPEGKDFEIDGNGDIYAKIFNYSGLVLPSTGGIGTTIFYIVGGLLVAGAVILLVTKRRMSASEE